MRDCTIWETRQSAQNIIATFSSTKGLRKLHLHDTPIRSLMRIAPSQRHDACSLSQSYNQSQATELTDMHTSE
ncbi:hypothetical protein LMH87_011397 [Akanthomyces muscarius]|uniref:Uncharacterized protein n=1 Tax=Akanthomyces muscarius TaxID=2231603 RepID=A0A9W8Q935_AKAMU|nr:hypothetical protein LMH87_011397 [Akanthomyces muscarius]KAJ4150657.1 hypothetical protein LMH87_011397 [Akanthomyces muscarius]